MSLHHKLGVLSLCARPWRAGALPAARAGSQEMGEIRVLNHSARSESVETGCRGLRAGRRLLGRREIGAAVTEFALVLSAMFVVIVVGFAGYALYLGNYLALQEAVSAGTRAAAISGGLTGSDPCGAATTAADAVYRAAAFESSTPTLTPTVSVAPPGLNGTPGTFGTPITSTTCASYWSQLVPGATVKVLISHPTQSLFSYGSFTVNAQAEAVVQGVPVQ